MQPRAKKRAARQMAKQPRGGRQARSSPPPSPPPPPTCERDLLLLACPHADLPPRQPAACPVCVFRRAHGVAPRRTRALGHCLRRRKSARSQLPHRVRSAGATDTCTRVTPHAGALGRRHEARRHARIAHGHHRLGYSSFCSQHRRNLKSECGAQCAARSSERPRGVRRSGGGAPRGSRAYRVG